MTTQQPAALWIAYELEIGTFVPNVLQNEIVLRQNAAAELRRQHAHITELESQLAQHFDAADMATAAAQGFRDGATAPAQPVAEPAKADSVLEDALSDALRVPLDSLHADAAYLIGRLREGSMPYARVIEIIRERIDAAKAAIRARASHGQAPAQPLTVAQVEEAIGLRSKAWDTIGAEKIVEAVLHMVNGQAPAQPDAPLPLLVRDIAAELGIAAPQACKSLFAAGCGETSVNMAVTPRMARALRAMHPTPSPQAAQQAPAGAAERLVQRMEDWTDARYIAELENVVRLLRRELEKLHRVREVLSDCSAGQPCSTCPNKKACQRGCIRQEEFVSTEYHARQVAAPAAPSTPASGGWISVDERLPNCSRKPDSLGVEVLIWPPHEDGSRTSFYGRRQSTNPNFYKYGALMNHVQFWAEMPAPPLASEAKGEGNG